MRNRLLGAFVAVLLAVTWMPTAVAHASIATTSGNIKLIAPPPSAQLDALEDPTSAVAWVERQGVTLASGLVTDIQSPGTYTLPAQLHNATIPAGTVVDSQIFHSDRPGVAGNSTGTIERIFTATFPTDILGIVALDNKLAVSDVLGSPGTAYFTGTAPNGNRGLNFDVSTSRDSLTMVDQRTVSVDLRTSSDMDEFRVITKHNSPPTANAGGPYVGTEGAPVALAGSAADVDGDPITKSWSLSYTGDAGTTCSLTGGTTFTPSVSCTDNALVTATLSVSDGVNPAVTSSTPVTIGNAPPTLGSLTVPTAAVPLGNAANVSVPFSDAGTNDTHTATVTWGDTTSSAGSVTESAGAGTVNAGHTYALAGLYTVTVTVSDDNLGTVSTTAQINVNGPPIADAAGPYSGSEGLPTTLVGTAVDPENDPLAVNWSFLPSALDPGASCVSSGTTTLTPSVTCNDDAVIAASLSASDGINPAVLSPTTVAIANEAPILGALGVGTGPFATGAPVSLSASFTDQGTNDTHTATIDWGDLSSSNATVSESSGSGSLAASHVYTAPGIYTVSTVLSDDDHGTDVRTATVVVNSPPTADTGGPYAGVEGAALALAGTAHDADGDPLTTSWTFAVAGKPGTTCTSVGADTLTPTLTCNDDATVTATLSVSDGINATVTEVTTITVGNAPPQSTAAVASSGIAPVGSTVSVGLTYSDVGTNDTHTATIDWGDGTVEPGVVTGTAGSGTVAGSHVYTTGGGYTIAVTVMDDDGDITTQTTTVLVNGSPTAGVGGPYSGVEGTPVTLTGTAADPDVDTLLVQWTSSIVSADPGTICSLTDATTLTPSLVCDDDAVVNVTFAVADGINPPVVDSTTVNIQNAAPSVAAPTVVPNPVPLGTPVSLSTTFTDPGVNDNPLATINWGDGHQDPGSVVWTLGTGSVTGGHTYTTPGTYTVTVTVNDKDGGTNSASVVVVVNAPPTIHAGGPYSGTEGTPLALAGTAHDPEGDPLALSWSFAVSTDPGGSCSFSGTATLVPSIMCTDDATVLATLRADDGVNPPVTHTATITINNVAPTIGLVTVPTAPVPIGTAVTALTTFADQGANDTHTATIGWGDSTTTAGVVNESAGNGSVTGSHAYAAAGTYTVSITIVDDDTGTVTGTATARIVVFDGGNGFVTGGGWITSPSGAYTPNDPSDPDLVGRANYGFVIKKDASDPVPTGNTEFQLRLAQTTGKNAGKDGFSTTPKFNFKADAYTSLAVTTSLGKAVYRGTGTLDGVAGYQFLVSVVDGRSAHVADKFRIKIWKASTGVVFYDNMPGAADDATATTEASGGSIIIH